MEKILTLLKKSALFISVMYCMFNPTQTVYHCRKAVDLCIYTALPSLFVFSVFSEFIALNIKKTSANFSVLKPFEKLFSIDKKAFPICIFSLFSGASAASTGLLSLYKNGEISKECTENALILFPGCSASFILTVAAATLDSTRTSIFLLISQILALFSSYFILCKRAKSFPHKSFIKKIANDGFCEEIIVCIKNTVKNMAVMCGFIVFFRTVSGVLGDLIYNLGIKSPPLTCFLFGLFEMTGGTVQCATVYGNLKIFLTSAVISFSGISVIFQVASIFAKHGISIKPFVFSRLLSAILCPIYMLIFMLIFPYNFTRYSDSAVASVSATINGYEIFSRSFLPCIAVLTAVVLLTLDKKYRKKEQKK